MHRNNRAPIFVLLLFLCVNLLYMGLFLGGPGRGNLDWHLLPTAGGVPKELAAKGFTPLHDSRVKGMDGQLYYYIANDLLGNKDTPELIPSEAYRYQRIGLPLAARAMATLLGQDWVSSATYYMVNLLGVSLGVWVLACFFSNHGRSPTLALLWGLSYGTTFSLIYGHQDGFADSMLILAIISHFGKRPVLYVLCATLACLSREVYILFPFVLWLFELYRDISTKQLWTNSKLSIKKLLWKAIPGIIWSVWQFYLFLHFGNFASSQGSNSMGGFLEFLPQYLMKFANIFFTTWHFEFVYLVNFTMILLTGFVVALTALKKQSRDELTPMLYFFISLLLLYL